MISSFFGNIQKVKVPMSSQKILYITTEMFPYQEESAMANLVNKIALKAHAEGNDVRVFMPKFGTISERKFQLHEVIRLSGMNVIINDLDQPLIIKVASLPGERLQVYFIDNDEYFRRKSVYTDEDGRAFDDLGERGIFFARGVIETIKKLNWVPDIIHLNGWMSAFVPLYLRDYYKNDSYFKDSKIILSLFNETVFSLEDNIAEKLSFDKIRSLDFSGNPLTQEVIFSIINDVDAIIKGDEFLDDGLHQSYTNATSQKYDYLDEHTIFQVYNSGNE